MYKDLRKYKDSIFVYRSQEIKSLIPGTDGQDGIYLVTPICGSIKPIDEIGYGVSEEDSIRMLETSTTR